MITFIRVDSRLVHGQVVEGWLPHLKVKRVVVLDEESAKSPLARASMGLAVPQNVAFKVTPIDDRELDAVQGDSVPTLVLVRDIDAAYAVHVHGVKYRELNLGNIHFREGRRAITPSVFLSGGELHELEELTAAGVEIHAQPLPTDKPMGLEEIEARFRSGEGSKA